MGNRVSKFCSILSYPLREYERKKTLKIYKEIVQQDYPIDENIGKYGLETIELI